MSNEIITTFVARSECQSFGPVRHVHEVRPGITWAMVCAGAAILEEFDDIYEPTETALDVFVAMLAVQKRPLGDKEMG